MFRHNLAEAPLVAWLTSSLLNIFPAGDFGIALMNATRRIFLYGETCKVFSGYNMDLLFIWMWNNQRILCISSTYNNAMIKQNGFGYIHLEVYLFCNDIYNLWLTNSAPRSSDYVSHRNLPCFFIRISGFRWEKSILRFGMSKNHQKLRLKHLLGQLIISTAGEILK